MGRRSHLPRNILCLLIPVLAFVAVITYLSRCNPESPPCKENVIKYEEKKSLIDTADQVSPAKKSHSAFLIVFIMSAPPLLSRRDILRQTWLRKRTSEIEVRFVVGSIGLSPKQIQTLKEENQEHGDILILPNVEDNFQSLTTKLLEMIVWADQNVDFKYFLKVDDDSFVRLDVMVRELQTKSRERLYWGFFDGRAHAHTRGKYAETEWKLCDRYIPYALGGGYVISADLVHFIARNAPYLKKYNGEDVSLGTWLAPVDVNRDHDPRFDTEYKSRGCRNVYIISHKQSIDLLKEKWKNLEKTGKMCTSEEQKRLSYVYNWNKLPSECCERVQGVP